MWGASLSLLCYTWGASFSELLILLYNMNFISNITQMYLDSLLSMIATWGPYLYSVYSLNLEEKEVREWITPSTVLKHASSGSELLHFTPRWQCLPSLKEPSTIKIISILWNLLSWSSIGKTATFLGVVAIATEICDLLFCTLGDGVVIYGFETKSGLKGLYLITKYFLSQFNL